MFRIWYADGSVAEGLSREDWLAAPGEAVQVVALYGDLRLPGFPDRLLTGYVHTGIPEPQLFTGIDEYDPLGWGLKLGSLISDRDYWAIWEEAHGNSGP